MYAELSYFEGYHFQHIAAWQEHRRLQRLWEQARRNISAGLNRGVPYAKIDTGSRGSARAGRL